MPRLGLHFKDSKPQIRLNRVQEICPCLTENHTAPVAKAKRFMLLIEVITYAESRTKNRNVARVKMQRWCI